MYDGRTRKQIYEQDLPVKEKDMGGDAIRTFDDGTSYFIINKNCSTASTKNLKLLRMLPQRISVINQYYRAVLQG